ncbi:MAG TPA: metalloregulator ArsR/SmtB family transcription factor [Victivallales bacterium]|nr:metalloregulator ArsR/SmtB family transcription factor [Victivallales bacterium]HPO90271.1 metalloregulator ArsR/SmtB family transcription factor [Victivallales bacterium]HRR06174.1 metalloregulator ArsR/SmtB family transcription factor [Victivallales bacterium]HRR28486.1 metalloregulator ArsR/SmtB family transcription factor [Victivallales bacterium]
MTAGDLREEKRAALILKAIAHPVRLRILQILLKGPCCATKTNELLPISQPNLSQHLKVLRSKGVIKFEKRGVKRCYFIDKKEEIRNLLKIIESLRDN